MTHEINPTFATDHSWPEELPLLLTVEELTRTLRISRTMAYELVNRRDFPAIHIGRAIRVPREALFQWLEAQQILSSKRSRLSTRK